MVNKLLNYITKLVAPNSECSKVSCMYHRVKRMGNQAVRMVHSSMVFRAGALEGFYNFRIETNQHALLTILNNGVIFSFYLAVIDKCPLLCM